MLYLDSNEGQSFSETEKRLKTCWWPEDGSWFWIAATYVGDNKTILYPEHQAFPIEGDTSREQFAQQTSDKKAAKEGIASFEKEKIKRQLTLESHLYNVLTGEVEAHPTHNETTIKSIIVQTCREHGLLNSAVSYIESLESIQEIIKYLILQAKASKGKPLTIPDELDSTQPVVTPTPNSLKHTAIPPQTSVPTICIDPISKTTASQSGNEKDLEFCTYFDLEARGLSAEEIAAQLIHNDDVLYGSNKFGEKAGSAQYWAEIIIAAPDSWLFLCQGRQIVGNWSFTYLSPSEEEDMKKGILAGKDFSLDNANYPLTSPDREIAIHLLNISLNDHYQSMENWIGLWKSFGKRLEQLQQGGFTVRSIYGCLFRNDHIAIFKQMGFQHLVQHRIAGDVYYLNLAQASAAKLSWIMPSPAISDRCGESITFRQLSHADILSEQQLMDIAGLIYDTDPYISEALFSSREQAKALLPLLFSSNEDAMFTLDNIFCAISGNRIIGLLLHKKGSLHWSADHLIRYANHLDEVLPDTVRKAETEYFSEYNGTASNDATSIIKCCVNSNYRLKSELRLGTHMLQAFLKNHPERLELYVLKETSAAMRLYLSAGFRIERKCNGFSVDHRKLPCYSMVRPAKEV